MLQGGWEARAGEGQEVLGSDAGGCGSFFFEKYPNSTESSAGQTCRLGRRPVSSRCTSTLRVCVCVTPSVACVCVCMAVDAGG